MGLTERIYDWGQSGQTVTPAACRVSPALSGFRSGNAADDWLKNGEIVLYLHNTISPIMASFKKIFSFVAAAFICFSATCGAQNRNVLPQYPQMLNELYQKADAAALYDGGTKPLIGVSVSNSMKATCTRAIELAGGVPVIIPETSDGNLISRTLDMLDGLMMSGGADVNPGYYGEEILDECGRIDDIRDTYELILLKKAIDRNIPIFGVCRGLQIINVAMGGTLYQDIPSQKPSEVIHRQEEDGMVPSHEVDIISDTELQKILGTDRLAVNSFHHQGIKDVAPGLRISAYSTDSIPEAIEAYPVKSILAVQWHPEINASRGDSTSQKLFEHFVRKASTFARAKEIHSRILSVDTHTDAPLRWLRGMKMGERTTAQVSIPKMQEGKLDAQFMAAYLGQGELTDEAHAQAVKKCQELIDSIYEQAEEYSDYVGIAVTEAEAWNLKAQGKKALFIGIENGYGIGKDLKNIRRFYDQGVNYITLCHSYDNAICHSSTHTEDENLGLTDFGKKVVKEMNRVGMVIDLSHASIGAFRDVMKYSKLPVMCSHTGAKDVYFHNRNINDDQLRALAKNGGVIQVCIFASYMGKDRTKTDVMDVVDHIDHCVKVAGIDHVGIGSDFDGGGGVIGCNGDNDMIQITVKLLEMGYSEEDLAKIWGGNFFRVLETNRKAGR